MTDVATHDEAPFRILAIVLLGTALAMRGHHQRRAVREGGALEKGGRSAVLVSLRLVGVVALLPVVAYLAHPPWVSWARLPLPSAVRWLAGAAGLATLPLLYWIFRTLGLNLSPSHGTRRRQTLVTDGPYRFVRHPLYATGFVFSVALALLIALWWPLAWLAPGLLILHWRTPKEEARLVEVFGDRYRDYMRHTGRYLPRLAALRAAGPPRA